MDFSVCLEEILELTALECQSNLLKPPKNIFTEVRLYHDFRNAFSRLG